MNQILNSLDDFKLKSLDHLPIVSDIIDKLKIVEIIDEMCPDSERFDISPGTVVKGFILSILSGKRALYKMSAFLNDYPIKHFFKSDIDPKKFTDDRLASVLDILYKNGLENIYSQMVIEVIKRYKLKINFIHSDTSSIKLQGVYEGFCEGPQAMHGYSKDHRPDLKQINFGLSMSNIEKLPLTFKMDSGNLSDDYFNNEQTKNLSKLSNSLNLRFNNSWVVSFSIRRV